jgi:hypothetical protein
MDNQAYILQGNLLHDFLEESVYNILRPAAKIWA